MNELSTGQISLSQSHDSLCKDEDSKIVIDSLQRWLELIAQEIAQEIVAAHKNENKAKPKA